MIKFDGFLKVYMESKDDDDSEEQDGMLPKLNNGEAVFFIKRLMLLKDLVSLSHDSPKLVWLSD